MGQLSFECSRPGIRFLFGVATLSTSGQSASTSDTRHSSAYLRFASNNRAEVDAIRLACSDLLSLFTKNPMIPRQEVFIFTDSTYALGAARGSFTPRTNRSAVRRLQTALDDLRKFVKATLAWVPGHASIRYNEEVINSLNEVPLALRRLPARSSLKQFEYRVGSEKALRIMFFSAHTWSSTAAVDDVLL